MTEKFRECVWEPGEVIAHSPDGPWIPIDHMVVLWRRWLQQPKLVCHDRDACPVPVPPPLPDVDAWTAPRIDGLVPITPVVGRLPSTTPPTDVPEPASALVLLVAILAVSVTRWRCRSSRIQGKHYG